MLFKNEKNLQDLLLKFKQHANKQQKNPTLYHMYHIYSVACHLDFCSSIKNSEVIKIYYFYILL